MPDLPTGTVTLFFTDMEGSTRLLQRLGEHYAAVLADCRRLLRSLFQQYNGQEVDTQGDAFFVAFARASDAVAAAAAIQRVLAEHAWPGGTSVRVRIGLHTGEPKLTADGYIGMDVHHAARIMGAAHGGQILLSQTTRDLVEQHLPTGTFLVDLGAHRLKDLQRPSQLLSLGAREKWQRSHTCSSGQTCGW
jgi:class 3 adenylate cyclase